MNRARILLLVCAFAAAGGAAFLVRSLTATPDVQEPTPQIVEAPKEVDVLVASRPLLPGAVIAPGDIRWQPWPMDGVTPSYISKTAAPGAQTDLQGAMVRQTLEAGEPLTRIKVVHAGEAGFMAAMLTPGMRAISIRISEDTGAGGFILPNDRVDVIMTREVPDEAGFGSNGHETQTILQNIRVLAIGQTYQGSEENRVVQGKTATLELTQPHAELIAHAGAMGDLTLALRSAAQSGITAALPADVSLMGNGGDNGSIRVIRYARPARVVPMSNNSKKARSHE